ncbi:Uncharacterized membrane protein [Caldanaerobius fijiensis DSM 17918]|uniref:Uncharacterized membrane protein n=1 Tax=Caldanaerobius fijiensis DSM 17918 TaxID=1121256 RepID=A0A1M5ATZ4_9THEO|nr:DUF969 domain-containing protein [Caldanaerobius fijiensis]SHF33690.1 Uncharacterized membrane protein [Caldanaerobius fijiensis DSM 17918]
MIKLIGVLIVILGFAFKFDAIGIVIVAGIVTGLVGGLDIVKILETLGSTFVANRYMSLFIMLLPVIAALERNGLRETATKFISKIKQATPGRVILSYGIIRIIIAAFNISLGGVVGFIRPVIQPMAVGSIVNRAGKIDEEDLEDIKAMGAAQENVSWFFGQVLFIAGAGILLVKSTLDQLGYKVTPLKAVEAEIPVAISAMIVSAIFLYIRDKKFIKKYFKETNVSQRLSKGVMSNDQ